LSDPVTGAESRGVGDVRRVFLECTSTRASRYNTGIQRAGRNLVNASLAAAGPWSCTAIVHNGRHFEAIKGLPMRAASAASTPTVVDRLRGAFHRAKSGVVGVFPGGTVRDALSSQRFEYTLRRMVHAAQNGLRWVRGLGAGNARRIEFRRGDVLVLLDPVWSLDLSGELRRARAAGAEVWVVVNDLIPLEFPDLAPEGSQILMDKWLRRVTPYAAGMLGISRVVAADLQRYFKESAAMPQPRIDWFYLGSGLDHVGVHAQDLAVVKKAFETGGGRVYLTVGTIEPRKNHEMMLDAFERLWAEGGDARLMMFGRLGWRSDRLARRIRRHPQFGHRLTWFETGSDAELDYAYRHASALIFASCYEGFGLPLVEAMHYGLPVIASDIAVFREIAGDYPTYFDLSAERSLDRALLRVENSTAETVARPAARPWLSWADSARMLLEKVTGTAGTVSAAQAGGKAGLRR
jgi:O-antigen biosynthesis alpha-1,2-rhamnosyltransferase